MLRRARADREAPAHLRRAGRAREPALPRVPARASTTFEPIDRAGDRGERDPDRQPGLDRAARSARSSASTASSSRRPKPSSPRPRAAADRTGLFTCPHTGVALAALEKLARAAKSIRRQRQGRRHLDGERPQVHGLQDPLPRGRDRRRRERASEPPGRAPERLRDGQVGGAGRRGPRARLTAPPQTACSAVRIRLVPVGGDAETARQRLGRGQAWAGSRAFPVTRALARSLVASLMSSLRHPVRA